MFRFTGKLLLLLGVILAWLVLLMTVSHSQTSIAVNIKTAKFTWQYVDAVGQIASNFKITCKPTVGATIAHIINDPTVRDYPVASVVLVPGDYSCFIVAENIFGSSLPSNTVSFVAGDVPLAPNNFGILSQ